MSAAAQIPFFEGISRRSLAPPSNASLAAANGRAVYLEVKHSILEFIHSMTAERGGGGAYMTQAVDWYVDVKLHPTTKSRADIETIIGHLKEEGKVVFDTWWASFATVENPMIKFVVAPPPAAAQSAAAKRTRASRAWRR